MRKEINKKIVKQIGKDKLIDSVLSSLNTERSQLLEIIGESGTGKSYLFKKLSEKLENSKSSYAFYTPRYYEISQFKHFITTVFEVTERQFETLVKDNRHGLESKYDFFYYFTEALQDEFSPKTILIDSCEIIEQYTIDFIQFFTEYANDKKIHFVIFTSKELFAFSKKVRLSFLGNNEILTILRDLIGVDDGFEIESELLYNISKGNIFILEEILYEVMSETRKSDNKKIELGNYIDKPIDVSFVYNNLLNKLNTKQLELAINIYLMDRCASSEILSDYFGFTEIEKDIKVLSNEGLIVENKGVLAIKKLDNFRIFFNQLQKKDQKKYTKKVLDYFTQNNAPESKIAGYKIFLNKCCLSDSLTQYLNNICAFEELVRIYKFLLEFQEKPEDKVHFLKKIGLSYTRLQKIDDALNYFRDALRLSTEKNIPSEEIVFYLAESHFNKNSSTFAYEIIKKFSPDYIDKYWFAKLILLKAEILVDLNNLEEAKGNLEQVYQVYSQIEEEEKSIDIFAEAKKQRGKIYYYLNQWDKAESSFKEAEKYFLMNGNKKGLAAVYNNIGVLKMFQGELKETEELYLKSLELEKERFNLSGISVCYNNLGGLWEDRGDYNRSLHFFQEALKIQRMLADKYNTCNLYNNIGVTYMNHGDYGKAKEAFSKTLEISINFNLYRNIIAVYNNLGALNVKSGKWNESIKFFEQAIEKSKEYKFFDGLCKSYNNLGELYEKKGEYNIACDFFFKALELLSEISDAYLKAEVWGNMGSILTHLHKFSEAYGYLVESLDFFKNLNAQDKIIEGNLKLAYYFILTRNYESSDYYIYQSRKKAKEINNQFLRGQADYLKSLLERRNKELAVEYLEKAKKSFVETNNIFELAKVNYEIASILEEDGKWEQALDILNSNKKVLKQFWPLSLIETNDILIEKIQNEYVNEINETKSHAFLLNKFSQVTQKLKSLNDFDVLLNESLDSLINLSDAEGGLLCLYNSAGNPDSWEYKIYNNYSQDSEDYDVVLNVIHSSFSENKIINEKQPSFAPQFNHIISFPLNFQNETIGVLLLYTKHGVYYFNEIVFNLVNAMCNQIVVILENLRYKNLAKTHADIREEISTANIFTNIIGKSDKIQKIFELIDKIKDTPTTVLLEGQSGTGKELIARAIHFTSNRKNKKFVAQYCGSLPETLLESELFGHMKGAFTGATYDKKGLFELADGGTFFLDEIADISLSTQAKLLRFLQEGEIKRVGSTKTQHVDVRVICATNTSVAEKVEKGEFRLDLYYRLNVIRIEMPSLRERKSDIPLLAVHFLDKYNKKIGKKVQGITDEAMKYMVRSDWPGNIRQLENEIERAVTLAEDNSFIKPSDLSGEIFRFSENTETIDLLDRSTLKDAVDKLEQEMILNSLNKFSWNQTQTAKELGLSRQGLIKKIKRYNLKKK